MMSPSVNYQGQYAGFISRFIAFALDLVIVSVMGFLVTLFVGLVINFFGLSNQIAGSALGGVVSTLQAIVLVSATLFTSLLGLAYYLFFWVVAGFTPGMGLLGLRIIRLDGQPVTVGPALLRFVGYSISALFLFMGFVWIIFDRRRQGWHDKLARTVVIYNWPPRK